MENLAALPSRHLLPELPYAHEALEPHIDARTMLLHHGKHHAGYVAALNAALQAFPDLKERSAPWLLLNPGKLPRAIRTSVLNNAGGHVNHSLFWQAMSPLEGGAPPTGALAIAIVRDFGSLAQFKLQFSEAGGKLFGSGWVWLVRVKKDGGRLQVCTTAGHDNPILEGRYPILVNDVWEHAYYLKHENRRAEYLDGWWSIANWKEAARRFEHFASSSGQSSEREMEIPRAKAM
jgi:Fe-Mn family superoxide dismutase